MFLDMKKSAYKKKSSRAVILPAFSQEVCQWLCLESLKTGLSIPELVESLVIKRCLAKRKKQPLHQSPKKHSLIS